ncbi:hypothetical protein KFE25_005724 [Diacronema lutheri]|uniref:AP2/ERF domain-containing protein n=1 Tax=Diacronema lutheri TaxID=2081491 RepID=A0A8J5X4J9_DIALT|nr:hypothetical protein KFE25_005724 [Diacronema lutheri]
MPRTSGGSLGSSAPRAELSASGHVLPSPSVRAQPAHLPPAPVSGAGQAPSPNTPEALPRKFIGVQQCMTKYSGVRFRARVKHKGVDVGLGTFDTALEAARAYDAFADKHPELRRNFPPPPPAPLAIALRPVGAAERGANGDGGEAIETKPVTAVDNAKRSPPHAPSALAPPASAHLADGALLSTCTPPLHAVAPMAVGAAEHAASGGGCGDGQCVHAATLVDAHHSLPPGALPIAAPADAPLPAARNACASAAVLRAESPPPVRVGAREAGGHDSDRGASGVRTTLAHAANRTVPDRTVPDRTVPALAPAAAAPAAAAPAAAAHSPSHAPHAAHARVVPPSAARSSKRPFFGVRREKSKRYAARGKHGRQIDKHLGTFDTAEQAARAYDAWAITLGRPLNFPPPEAALTPESATDAGARASAPSHEPSHARVPSPPHEPFRVPPPHLTPPLPPPLQLQPPAALCARGRDGQAPAADSLELCAAMMAVGAPALAPPASERDTARMAAPPAQMATLAWAYPATDSADEGATLGELLLSTVMGDGVLPSPPLVCAPGVCDVRPDEYGDVRPDEYDPPAAIDGLHSAAPEARCALPAATRAHAAHCPPRLCCQPPAAAALLLPPPLGAPRGEPPVATHESAWHLAPSCDRTAQPPMSDALTRCEPATTRTSPTSAPLGASPPRASPPGGATVDDPPAEGVVLGAKRTGTHLLVDGMKVTGAVATRQRVATGEKEATASVGAPALLDGAHATGAPVASSLLLLPPAPGALSSGGGRASGLLLQLSKDPLSESAAAPLAPLASDARARDACRTRPQAPEGARAMAAGGLMDAANALLELSPGAPLSTPVACAPAHVRVPSAIGREAEAHAELAAAVGGSDFASPPMTCGSAPVDGALSEPRAPSASRVASLRARSSTLAAAAGGTAPAAAASVRADPSCRSAKRARAGEAADAVRGSPAVSMAGRVVSSARRTRPSIAFALGHLPSTARDFELPASCTTLSRGKDAEMEDAESELLRDIAASRALYWRDADGTACVLEERSISLLTTCDVCHQLLAATEPWTQCASCGDFDVCERCVAGAAAAEHAGHVLVRREPDAAGSLPTAEGAPVGDPPDWTPELDLALLGAVLRESHHWDWVGPYLGVHPKHCAERYDALAKEHALRRARCDGASDALPHAASRFSRPLAPSAVAYVALPALAEGREGGAATPSGVKLAPPTPADLKHWLDVDVGVDGQTDDSASDRGGELANPLADNVLWEQSIKRPAARIRGLL